MLLLVESIDKILLLVLFGTLYCDVMCQLYRHQCCSCQPDTQNWSAQQSTTQPCCLWSCM